MSLFDLQNSSVVISAWSLIISALVLNCVLLAVSLLLELAKHSQHFLSKDLIREIIYWLSL